MKKTQQDKEIFNTSKKKKVPEREMNKVVITVIKNNYSGPKKLYRDEGLARG